MISFRRMLRYGARIHIRLRALLKMSQQPENFTRHIRDFSLVYQDKNLFPYIKGNFTLFVRLRILLSLTVYREETVLMENIRASSGCTF